MLKPHIRRDEVEMQQFVFTPVYTSRGGMMLLVLVVQLGMFRMVI
ncbi:hypothetical protein Hanom_Chr01g00008321 [Helianthus anomalus]